MQNTPKGEETVWQPVSNAHCRKATETGGMAFLNLAQDFSKALLAEKWHKFFIKFPPLFVDRSQEYLSIGKNEKKGKLANGMTFYITMAASLRRSGFIFGYVITVKLVVQDAVTKGPGNSRISLHLL